MPLSHPAVATAGVVAISVAVAAAIAVYESPELRRMADELRRKVALAFHSFGDIIQPGQNEPLFNRPEDAEGFFQSRGTTDPDIVADDETLQRQRQELMYWNAKRLEKEALELMEKQKADEGKQADELSEKVPRSPQKPIPSCSTTFDDFMRPDQSAGQGTFVFNTGTNIPHNDEGLVQRHPNSNNTRGLQISVLSNPFGNNCHIPDSIIAPSRDEMPDTISSSITPSFHARVSANERTDSDLYDDIPTPKRRLSVPEAASTLPAVTKNLPGTLSLAALPTTTSGDVQLESPSFVPSDKDVSQTVPEMTGSQKEVEIGNEAFSSIQAWAHNQSSNPSFYSPIPVSPVAPVSEISEPDVISQGEFTPTDTDSLSLAGSGVDLTQEVNSRAGENFDVMSDSDGMVTPASWTEVGSVISEEDHPVHV